MSEVPGMKHLPGNSVIRFLEQKTGDAPRITLREEDSASVSAPLIDPSSKEKLSVPQGRGNYQLMGEIARGGMGVVLKGHDTDLGRDIAVKVLDKRLCNRMDVVQRFVEEAQIGGQLQHPGIVPVYELGLMEDDRPYFTMKLVKGRTLAAFLAQRETPSANRGRLIDIFESICQTIAYAHSRGVIHRDLKPANIMVGAFGEVQVVDWGLAKVLVRGGTADEKRAREAHSNLTVLETVRSDGSGSATQSLVGSVLGTPAYMPPEQASGQVNRLDERADVFALGAILCEILTGYPPYLGEPHEVIAAAAQAELDGALERLDACDADPVLIKAAKQCLMAAPAARPADAGVLAERIHDYVMSNEERARRAEVEAAEARVRAEDARKARRLTLALGAAVVAIVLVGSGGWLWVQNERAHQERAETQRLQAAAERNQELSGEINAALNDAAVLEGRARWDEAILAAERARALAQGGGASGELLEAVTAKLASLHAEVAASKSRAEGRRDTQRLLAELRQVAQPSGQVGEVATGQQFRDAFLTHGIDLDAGDLGASADKLTGRGLGSEIALALDAWGEARRIEGDEQGALRLLEIAHLVDPDPDRAHLREAMAVRDLEELRYLASVGFSNQPASTWALLATSLVRLEDRELALSVYRTGTEKHPDDFQLHYLLASELTPGPDSPGVPEEMREGQRHYQAALAIKPDTHWARHYLARLMDHMGDGERAFEQLNLAIELAPDTPDHWFRKAQLLVPMGRYDEAAELYERCVALEEPHWSIGWGLASLAHMAAAKGEHERALELARQALATTESMGYYIRTAMFIPHAVIAGATGENAALIEAREQFELEFGIFATAHAYYSGFLLFVATNQGRHWWTDFEASGAGRELLLSEVIDLAREGLKLDPEIAGLWKHLGLASYFLGDAEAAISALTRQDELDGEDDPINWFSLALAHDALGDDAEARTWYQRALARMAKNPELSDVRTQWFLAEATHALGVK